MLRIKFYPRKHPSHVQIAHRELSGGSQTVKNENFEANAHWQAKSCSLTHNMTLVLCGLPLGGHWGPFWGNTRGKIRTLKLILEGFECVLVTFWGPKGHVIYLFVGGHFGTLSKSQV